MLTTAVEFSAPKTVELIETQLAAVGDGQALVRTLYSGLSGGTETLAYRGEIDPALPLDETLGALSGTFSWPFRYGYSIVGRVDQSRCSVPEGALVFCFHPHQAHIVLAESDLIALPEIEPRLATLLPLVETALQISLDAGPVGGRPVVVTGLGAVGILAGGLLARAGATVVGSDPLPWRRDAARSFSITSDDPSDLESRVADLTTGRGVPLVVEASGNPDALAQGLDLLAHEGTALVASWYGIKPVPLALGGAFHRRRLTLRSTQVSTIPAHLSRTWTKSSRMEKTLELMQELPLEVLATHEFPLSQLSEAFRAVDAGSEGLIHAALAYEGG